MLDSARLRVFHHKLDEGESRMGTIITIMSLPGHGTTEGSIFLCMKESKKGK